MIPMEMQERERCRIEQMVPRFLAPLLSTEWNILSIGCGAGSDVLELRCLGYKAWGLDPARLSLADIPEAEREYFRVGTMEEQPFGDRKFEFAYALDVIEHVGCIDFKTTLQPNAHEVRRRFVASCLDALKPGGTLLLTTSNKLFPIDVGHWHSYHWFGRRLAAGRRKFGVSLPWSRRNFLLSLADFRQLVTEVAGEGSFEVSCVETANYPSLSARRDLWSRLVAALIRFTDKPFLIGSPVAPILIIRIRKNPAAA